MTTRTEGATVKPKWGRVQWFSEDDTPEERKFLVKLDLIMVPFLLVSYWVKNLDQNNLNNAYVAGMKEELGFYGNELIKLQTMYIIGAVLGQLPLLFLFTYIPMYWLLPGMDIGWGIFTLLQFRANSYAEMAAYRFFVGWFEAAYFPAVHYVLGSWYRRHEISRRGGIWYLGVPIGTLTAGLVQSAATTSLEGVNGLSGWRWMYIICAIITLPVGIIGYFIIPGTIAMPNLLVLKEKDLNIARRRLERSGHVVQGKLKLHHIKEIFSSKHFYIVVLIDVLFWNCSANSGAFLLWLKSLSRYNSAKVNQFGTLPSALGIFYTLFANFSSDLLWGPAWGITFAAGYNSVALLILIIWNVPEGAKWFAYCSTSWSYALSSVLHGWANNILKDSPETRGFTLVFMTIMSQSSTAWTGLLAYPTVQAPRFPHGYVFSFSCAISLILFTHILNTYMKRKGNLKRNPEEEEEEEGQLGNSDREEIMAGSKQAAVYIQPLKDGSLPSSVKNILGDGNL